jgi:mannose/cellobiose epimerase-like protein (N-acyl-D-glucosamine 2-epimerase family)
MFETAVEISWDEVHEGFYYTVKESGEPVVADKYGWAHAEAIGASALLQAHDEAYLEWYDRLWSYVREHFINPKYGNWYERLTREHERDDPNNGVVVEPGYHPLTNC